jgi:hypothetical protein
LLRRTRAAAVTAALIIVGSLAPEHLVAQWIRHPTAGLPRLADGTVPNVPPNPHDATTSRRMICLDNEKSLQHMK